MNVQFSHQSITLFKVGGSLLNWETLPGAIECFLKEEAKTTKPILIVGGGEAANVVREWSNRYSLSEEVAHHLAIHSLTLTEKLITQLLPCAELVANDRELQAAWADGKIPILMTQKWLTHHPLENLDALPLNWSVTTDSIAVRIAVQLKIDTVVLLKSIDLPDGTTLETAVESNWVDQHFPAIVRNARRSQCLTLYWKNLRSNRKKAPIFSLE